MGGEERSTLTRDGIQILSLLRPHDHAWMAILGSSGLVLRVAARRAVCERALVGSKHTSLEGAAPLTIPPPRLFVVEWWVY